MSVEQLLFILVLAGAVYAVVVRGKSILGNILRGRGSFPTDRRDERCRNVWLVAFGQKKMFKRPGPAILHFFVYAGFLVINIEVLEFVIDGIVGTHRVFAPYLGQVYPALMNVFEFLAVAVLLSCLIFLFRRNV